jgi:hypothetical protein
LLDDGSFDRYMGDFDEDVPPHLMGPPNDVMSVDPSSSGTTFVAPNILPQAGYLEPPLEYDADDLSTLSGTSSAYSSMASAMSQLPDLEYINRALLEEYPQHLFWLQNAYNPDVLFSDDDDSDSY